MPSAQRRRIVATALVLASLSGCSTATMPTTLPSTAVPSALALASPSPSEVAVASQPASPDVSPLSPAWSPVIGARLHWEPFATMPDRAAFNGVVPFGSTYVAFGEAQSGVPWTWTSPSGKAWDGAPLGKTVEPCPGYALDYDSMAYAGATDGGRIVLVGLEYAMDVTPCGTHRAVAWVSSDGLAWQRSQGFGAVDGFGDAKEVWAVNGQWETQVWTGSGEPTTLWRSADGLTWQPLGPLGAPGLDSRIDIAADGARVMTLYYEGNGVDAEVDGLRAGQAQLRRSSDGVSWTDVAWDFNGDHEMTTLAVVPRSPVAGGTWLVIAYHDEARSEIWTSTDLVAWKQGSFPMDVIGDIAFTRYGYVANGHDRYCGDGGECPPNPAVQFVSADGLTWTAMEASVEATRFVDGSAGVLAFGDYPDFKIWQLAP